MRDIIGMESDVTLKIAFCCVTLFTLRDIIIFELTKSVQWTQVIYILFRLNFLVKFGIYV